MINNEPPYVINLFKRAAEKSVPLSVTFEITTRCNFNCKMCYIHTCNHAELEKNELSTETWKHLADEAKKAGCLFLLITGGEPLLRPDFPEIYTYCKELGFEVSINSNASLINDDIIELFKEYPPAKISVTAYGKDDETYKKVTERDNMFSRVEANIAKLKNAGIRVKMNITASNYNSADIPSLFEFADKYSMPVQIACYLFPSARLNRETDRPTPEEAAYNSLIVSRLHYKDNYKEYCEFFKKHKFVRNAPVPAVGTPILCRGGIAACWISYDGKMTPCGMVPIPSANALDGFESAWKYINSEAKKITLPPECNGCEYIGICDVCYAACYSETGRFDGVPLYKCKKVKEYCRLIKEENI